MNHELDRLIEGTDIVRFVKAQILAWCGHVYQMEESRLPKKVMLWKPMGRRKKGRPRERWLDDVEEDITVMEIGG